MYLIFTAIAALVSTVIWYKNAPEDKYMLNTLSLIYWGATLMWLPDHIIAYLTEGGEFFDISLNATLLGVNVVILGLVVWLIILLVKDPKKVFNKALRSQR